MKMSQTLFDELLVDCKAYLAYTRPDGIQEVPSVSAMWGLFHAVMFDRMQDDNHPAWRSNGGNKVRVLPFWSRNGATSRDAQEPNDHWLNRFYREEDLNDSHIETALKKIAKLL